MVIELHISSDLMIEQHVELVKIRIKAIADAVHVLAQHRVLVLGQNLARGSAFLWLVQICITHQVSRRIVDR